MSLRAVLACLVTAGMCAVPVAGAPAAVAAPAETGLAVVSNQDASGSCTVNRTTAYDNRVVLANPATGAFHSDLGKPAGFEGKLNDAKPFDNNRKVIAIWGRQSDTKLGGVGIYDRAAGAWTTWFPLPADFGGGDGLAHSVAALPGGAVAVAQTGTIASSGWGWIAVFKPGATAGTATLTHKVELKGVHGVEWDSPRAALFAVGDEHLKRYAYDAETGRLSERENWAIPVGPGGAQGGHDLRKRRANDDYFVTTNDQVYTFRPEVVGSAAWTTYDPPSTKTSLGGGWKGIDETFAGKVVHTYGKETFYFADGTSKLAGFCMKAYKVRWIYNVGDPVYEEESTSATTTGAPLPFRERFLWEENMISNGPTVPLTDQKWTGGAAGDSTPESTREDVRKAFATTKVPVIMFYHWGDSGEPEMDEVEGATDGQLKKWNDYAAAIAAEIGTREAVVVVEPEWDSNVDAPCDSGYERGLRTVVGTLQKAENALILNGMGMWKSETEYKSCFIARGLDKIFDGHGFILHLVSSEPTCRLRHPDHDKYDEEPYYNGGKTFDEAMTAVKTLATDRNSKFNKLKRYFGVSTAWLYDIMVTSCGFQPSGQADIIGAIVDRMTDTPPAGVDVAQAGLYSKGLRGVVFRDGGPDPAERYLGDKNEGGLAYKTNPDAMAEITRGRQVMEAYLGGMGPTEPVQFESSATHPANVAPGSPAAIEVSVTATDGSMSGANVDLEIFDPSGNRVAQQTWGGQSFVTGQTRTYPYTWNVPSTAVTGPYRLKIGVFDASWTSPPVDWNDNAGTITVGTDDPAFTSSASATPSPVTPGGTSTITATVNNVGGALSNGQVTVQVRSGSLVESEWRFAGQNIPAGGSQSYSATWTAPSTGGTYTIAVAVTGANGTPTYHTNGNAGTVSVAHSRFTSTASVSRRTVQPGGATTITANVTNSGTDSLSNGIVDVEIWDADTDTKLTQQYWTGQTILPGTTSTYTWTWTAPATASGSYVVKIGVFTASWADTLHWNGHAAAIEVGTPEFELSASARPAKVQAGGPTTITVTATNVGGALDNAIVDAEVYNSAGTKVAQQYWTGQTFVYGDTKTYTWSWTAPSTLGTYTIKVGVMDAGWDTTYEWNNNAGSIVVADPKFTSAADVSASSVSPGGTVTITATFTNTGGSMTNGRTQLEIHSSTGRVAVEDWGAQSIETGYSKSYSYTWTAPSTAGTYTVKLGVFTNDWSKTWHWNGSAGSISVGSSTFQPSFRIGDGANAWWIEVYTSNDVTGVDVIGKDGAFYMSLTKKSWGAWAGTSLSELDSNDLVRFIARRSSDGATAGSNNFYWLAGTPTTDPGWVCSFTVGSGASTSWVEVAVSSAATTVEVKVGNGAFTALTYSSTSGKWGKAMSVPAGSKVVFRATRSGGARAYSPIYNWLQ